MPPRLPTWLTGRKRGRARPAASAYKAAVVAASRPPFGLIASATVIAAALAATLTLHAAPDAATSADSTREYRYVMGTSVEVRAFGGTHDVRRDAITAAFGAFTEVDRLMSDYQPDSELTHVNRSAA